MFSALSAGLARGEFFALYQPQVTAEGLSLAGAEALLRWRRPGAAVVDPEDFVRYAEGHGLIQPLGAFILNRACQAAAAWPWLKIAVNVSPRQFMRRDLAEFIRRTATEAGLPLARLEIEITETAPIPDLAQARDVLTDLRESGVSVALDDLGCGGSTPELMRALPLDRAKLAKPTVAARVTTDGAATLRDLISAAKDCGLAVTAEGIETAEDAEDMRALGCDLLQGYFFGRPMPAEEFDLWRRQRMAR